LKEKYGQKDEAEEKKSKQHRYSKWWDTIQRNTMGHVKKDVKVFPTMFQINQRINMYEAVIDKTNNQLFEGDLDDFD